jgi:putative FmdB family regulatory protein
MPTYEYLCDKCKHEFEKIQSITAKPLTVCPKDICPRKPWGKGKVKHVLSTGGGLLFKGTGFYTTDYRSEGYKAAAKKEAGSTASTDGAKKESKPADATKPKAGGSTPPSPPAKSS